jgi:hypothetical protein
MNKKTAFIAKVKSSRKMGFTIKNNVINVHVVGNDL